jgi:transcriptional regulator with XRE-family HTH domain
MKKRADGGGWDGVGFGVEVRRLRRARGLSARAIQVAMGWSEKSVSAAWRLEIGLRAEPPLPRAMRGLAAELGTTEAHLLKAGGYVVVCGCEWCTGKRPARPRLRGEPKPAPGRGEGWDE